MENILIFLKWYGLPNHMHKVPTFIQIRCTKPHKAVTKFYKIIRCTKSHREVTNLYKIIRCTKSHAEVTKVSESQGEKTNLYKEQNVPSQKSVYFQESW